MCVAHYGGDGTHGAVELGRSRLKVGHDDVETLHRTEQRGVCGYLCQRHNKRVDMRGYLHHGRHQLGRHLVHEAGALDTLDFRAYGEHGLREAHLQLDSRGAEHISDDDSL